MDLLQIQKFLMICSIINIVLGIIMFVVVSKMREKIYKIHYKFFPITKSQFNTIIYGLMAFYKIQVFVFNIVPWIAISILIG